MVATMVAKRVRIAAVALASATAIIAVPAHASAAGNPHKHCGQRRIAAIQEVRYQMDPHHWYQLLFAADVPAAGLAYHMHLDHAQVVLRKTLWLEEWAIRRQCEGGD